ncbi:uncharacterized protein LOC108675582 [Hyalella azteca]|uniref:Uncharacterized protein LOC108675582 n=1 Tax=Hyalella azteca TaxID=294128 RepID=A0A8B7NZ43_HYAAZ|nr:uncharacterized protein LOC108675582 [Hyalella azteca]
MSSSLTQSFRPTHSPSLTEFLLLEASSPLLVPCCLGRPCSPLRADHDSSHYQRSENHFHSEEDFWLLGAPLLFSAKPSSGVTKCLPLPADTQPLQQHKAIILVEPHEGLSGPGVEPHEGLFGPGVEPHKGLSGRGVEPHEGLSEQSSEPHEGLSRPSNEPHEGLMPLASIQTKHLTFGNELTMSYIKQDCPSDVALITSDEREKILHCKISGTITSDPLKSVSKSNNDSDNYKFQDLDAKILYADPFNSKVKDEGRMNNDTESIICTCVPGNVNQNLLNDSDELCGFTAVAKSILGRGKGVAYDTPTHVQQTGFGALLQATSDEYSSSEAASDSSSPQQSEDESDYLALLGLLGADDSDLREFAELHRGRRPRRGTEFGSLKNAQTTVLAELADEESDGSCTYPPTKFDVPCAGRSLPVRKELFWAGIKAFSPLEDSHLAGKSLLKPSFELSHFHREDDGTELTCLEVNNEADKSSLPASSFFSLISSLIGVDQNSGTHESDAKLHRRTPLSDSPLSSLTSGLFPVGFARRRDGFSRCPSLKRLLKKRSPSLFNKLAAENESYRKAPRDVNVPSSSYQAAQDYLSCLRYPARLTRRYDSLVRMKLLKAHRLLHSRRAPLLPSDVPGHSGPKSAIKRRSFIRELFPRMPGDNFPVLFPEFKDDQICATIVEPIDFVIQKLHRNLVYSERKQNWLIRLSCLTRRNVAAAAVRSPAAENKFSETNSSFEANDVAFSHEVPARLKFSREGESSKFSDDLSLSTIGSWSSSSTSLHLPEFRYHFGNSGAVERVYWRLSIESRQRVTFLLQLYLSALSGQNCSLAAYRQSSFAYNSLLRTNSCLLPIESPKGDSSNSLVIRNEALSLILVPPIDAVRVHYAPSVSVPGRRFKKRKKIPSLRPKPLIDLAFSTNCAANFRDPLHASLFRLSSVQDASISRSPIGAATFSPHLPPTPSLTPVWIQAHCLYFSSTSPRRPPYLRCQDSFGASESHLSRPAAAFCLFCLWMFFMRLADGFVSFLMFLFTFL